jgi:dephospho-CoA kinase
MFVLGLTGSIGMGKSAAARMFCRLGVPVYDADAAVHRLLGRDGAAVGRIGQAFSDVVRDGAVDRKALGARVFGKPDELRRLERIIHPMVALAQRRFLARAARRRDPLVVLDVPLLFETGGEARTDAIAVVSAPGRLQRARVLARPGMTEDKLAAVLRQQVPDSIKRQRADFIIPSGLGFRNSLRKVAEIVTICSKRQGHVWPPRRRPPPRPARHPSRRPLHARNRSRH